MTGALPGVAGVAFAAAGCIGFWLSGFRSREIELDLRSLGDDEDEVCSS